LTKSTYVEENIQRSEMIQTIREFNRCYTAGTIEWK